MIGIVALTLIVSQTPWFRDWLRQYIVRESKQYLNGELSIGGLSGNLLFGVGLSDVAVDLSGQRVVAVKALQVDYSVFRILSNGIVIDDVKLTAPAIHIERDASGWNLGRLVRKQAQEANRKGPGRPISFPSIEVSDGTIAIDDKIGSASYRLPSHVDGLHIKGSFLYEPVHFSVTLEDVRFHGTSPDLTLQHLAGGLSVRDDNLYLEQVRIRTAESNVAVGGVIERYLQKPVLQISSAGTAALAEIGRVVPALDGYPLTPTFDVKGAGPIDRLALDVNVQSQTGNASGKLTADFQSPDLGVEALGAGGRVYRHGTALGIEYGTRLFLQFFFPLSHLRRMYAKRLGDFGYGLDPTDRLKCDLGFELTAEILTLFFIHHLLLLTAGYHLILLSDFWGPL